MIKEYPTSWSIHKKEMPLQCSKNESKTKLKFNTNYNLSYQKTIQAEVDDPNSYIPTKSDIKNIESVLSSFSGLITIDNQDYFYKKSITCPDIIFDSQPENHQNVAILNDIILSKKIVITPQNKRFLFHLSMIFSLSGLIHKTRNFTQEVERSHIYNLIPAIFSVINMINSIFFIFFECVGLFQAGFLFFQHLYKIFLINISDKFDFLNIFKFISGFATIIPLSSILIIIIYHLSQYNQSFFYKLSLIIQTFLEIVDHGTQTNILLSVYCPLKQKYQKIYSILLFFIFSFLTFITCMNLYSNGLTNYFSIFDNFIFKLICYTDFLYDFCNSFILLLSSRAI